MGRPATKAFASVAFEKRMRVFVETELSRVLGQGDLSACQKGTRLSLVKKGEKFHRAGLLVTEQNCLFLTKTEAYCGLHSFQVFHSVWKKEIGNVNRNACFLVKER